MTFASTANAAYFCGAEAAFADINPHSVNLDEFTVREQLEADNAIKIVVPVLLGAQLKACQSSQNFAGGQVRELLKMPRMGLAGRIHVVPKLALVNILTARFFFASG